MNDEHESRNTAWGIIAGVGFVVLTMFYAISSGAMNGSPHAGACSSCRHAGDLPQGFDSAGSLSSTEK